MVDGDDDVFALRRAVVEGNAEGIVAATDHDARSFRRYERAGDTDVFAFTEQVIGIAEAEGARVMAQAAGVGA